MTDRPRLAAGDDPDDSRLSEDESNEWSEIQPEPALPSAEPQEQEASSSSRAAGTSSTEPEEESSSGRPRAGPGDFVPMHALTGRHAGSPREQHDDSYRDEVVKGARAEFSESPIKLSIQGLSVLVAVAGLLLTAVGLFLAYGLDDPEQDGGSRPSFAERSEHIATDEEGRTPIPADTDRDEAFLARPWDHPRRERFDRLPPSLLDPAGEPADSVDAELSAAADLILRGELDEARVTLEALDIEDAGRRAERKVGLGMIALGQGNAAYAEELFQEALALDPGSRPALSWLAEVQKRRGAIEPARGVMDRLIAVLESDALGVRGKAVLADALIERAGVLLASGDPEGAARDLARAEQLLGEAMLLDAPEWKGALRPADLGSELALAIPFDAPEHPVLDATQESAVHVAAQSAELGDLDGAVRALDAVVEELEADPADPLRLRIAAELERESDATELWSARTSRDP